MSGENSLYDKGKEVRIAVLGEAHVKRSLAARQSEFAKPLQDFTTEYCWGKVWSRPELDRRSRSLVTDIHPYLGFMIALHSWHELGIHTKGALRNGVTEVEIREVIMQSMVYCGVPAGVQALKVAETAINEMIESGDHQRQLKEKV
ncbi:putative 4-carboxymuconolactone decarboxylase [Exophiala viscosa]|uniref:4-carboxymuconolactone decarboxylase n=1 Tax=Exophiala viscosa TaxID=2486360 RepID=A0AAN6IEC0_9EURO|nr:putative 4-carboxymuconolactone decarboxylase [Exophiala viscosa]KAI1619928.1 putative 4-carboxymuconolactone decarboxylase [Exophiala viscosa]